MSKWFCGYIRKNEKKKKKKREEKVRRERERNGHVSEGE
jgi:hypothetical protein